MIMNVESIIQLIYADKLLTKLRKKIEAGLGTFKDTTDYCNRSAELLGRLFSENVLSMSDVERITANDTLLKDRYKDINDLLDKVQRTVDKAQGINIRPQHAPFNQERADQIGHSLTDKTVSEETIQRRAGSAPATMTRAIQDDYVEENAKFRSDAGLKTYLVRVTDGDCCEWCTKVAGRYEYGTEPHDIYRRHDNCGCSVTYENGRQRQNVWTKKTWEVPAEDAGAPEPVRLTKEQAAAAGAPPPKVFSKEEAKKLEAEKLKGNKIVLNPDDVNNSSIDNLAKGAILKREYNEEDIIRAITQEGTNFVTKDPNDPESIFGELVELVPRDERYYDIKAHGSPEAVKLFGSVVDANTLARVITMRKDYDGKPIRLLCCETGKMVDGTCFAKELSKLLQVDVHAPTEDIWVSTLGEIKIESKESGKKGFMKPFKYKR